MSVANPSALVLDHHHAHEHGQDWSVNPESLNAVFILNACAVAALTWVVYDFLLSFGEEISLVWNRCCYVAVNMTTGLTHDFCSAWYYILVINATAITLAPDAMILLRINAVYHWDAFVLCLTIGLFATQMVTSLVIGMLIMSSGDIQRPRSALPVPGCSLSFNHHPKLSLAAWIPSLAAQCIYFILMLITLVHVMRGLDVRGRASAESLHQVRKLVPTMMVFISHGTYYFSLKFGLMTALSLFISAILAKVINAIVVVTASGPLREIGIPWIMALYPVLVTKIYLNMVQYLHGRRGRIQYLRESPHTAGAEGEDANHEHFHFNFSFASSSDEHAMPSSNNGDAERTGGDRRGSAYFRTGLGQITFATRSSLAVYNDAGFLGDDV
ncbi:hypothetical protein BJ165DRAFT_1407555 [Panaeolus papilionaceus]|nr:hypothetical protein BJ165DRAFT_1407555 [Panaeolus papilionaceus]